MTRLSLWVITCFGMALVVFQSFSGGPATFAGMASTGAPGDNNQQCVSCHFGGNFDSVSVQVRILKNNEEISAYTPNEIYDIEVILNVTGGNPGGYGFQMVCIDDSLKLDQSLWSDPGSNVQFKTLSNVNNESRFYAEHNGLSISNLFTMKWTAPDSNTGPVSMYLGANIVNGNGEAGAGDTPVMRRFGIEEHSASSNDTSTIDTTDASSIAVLNTSLLEVYPNPATSYIHLEYEGEIQHLQILNSEGKVVKVLQPTSGMPLDIRELSQGIYFCSFPERSSFTKFIKL